MASLASTSAAASVATPLRVTPSFSGLAPCRLRSTKAPAVKLVSSSARVQCSATPLAESMTFLLAAAGDVSDEGFNYLIIGAVAVALIGTGLPILFARKDTCPVCDGSGFVRSGKVLAGNAGRKDDARIVCQNCKGLGKINQTDKA